MAAERTSGRGSVEEQSRSFGVTPLTRLPFEKRHSLPVQALNPRAHDGREAAMSNTVDVQQLEENRYAVLVDGIVRYVGSLEECRRRAVIFSPGDGAHETRDHALRRAVQFT
jgi:hypothetical protein